MIAPKPFREPRSSRGQSAPWVIWLMAAVYIGAHIPFLAQSAHDIDEVNFTLALHEYDVTKNQPHAPGAPLFVGLGKIARTAIDWAVDDDTSSASARRALDVAALAVWSMGLGAVAAFGLYWLFTGLGQVPLRASLAGALTLASPLLWFTGIRPMSDVPGLAMGLLALAAIVPWLSRVSDREPSRAGLTLGCFLAGLAPGMRVQMAWLTWPAAAGAVTVATYRRQPGTLLAVGAWLVGVAAWTLPLALVHGGPVEYVRLMRLQGIEEVAAGQMLVLSPTARGAALALWNSLVAPWGAPWLGLVALGWGALGALHVLTRQPRVGATLALLFGPYSLLHLGFHDTSHIRYGLPLMPALAMLATEGLFVPGRRVGIGGTGGLVAAALAVAISPVVLQSRQPAPVFQAIDDVRERLATTAEQPVFAMHHAVAVALRGETAGVRLLPSPVRYEWLELAKYWHAGGASPVWFLANRFRTDLALVDPASRALVRAYRYPEGMRALLAGSRPRGVDWVEIKPPGWVALEGWALTPEVRGVTARELQGNRRSMPRAFIRRRTDEAAILLGGRNLGGPCSTAATLKVWIDDHEFQRFDARPGETFVHLWRVPPGRLAGRGRFAELRVSSADHSGAGRQVDVALEQFAVQSAGGAIAALAEGWFEPEYDLREGVAFRWMSERATIRVDSFDRDIVLRLRGGTPRREFSSPSDVVVRAGGQLLATRSIADAFKIELEVPARVLNAAGGQLEVEASQAFVPDERFGNGDRRVLALRVFGVEVSVRETVVQPAEGSR